MFYNAFLLGSDCFKNIGVPTRTNLTTVVDNEISPPNECPPPVWDPIVPRQTAGFYTQAGIPHQAASPYPHSRVPSRLYPKN